MKKVYLILSKKGERPNVFIYFQEYLKTRYQVEIIQPSTEFTKEDVECVFIPLEERDVAFNKNLTEEGVVVIVYKNYGDNHLCFEHQNSRLLSHDLKIQRPIYTPCIGYVIGKNKTDNSGLEQCDFADKNWCGPRAVQEIICRATAVTRKKAFI